MRVTLESLVVAAEIDRVLGHLNLRQLLAGKRLLLTGSTGFFGKWLLAALARLNRDGAAIEVMAVSRFPDVFLREYPEYAGVGWISWLKNDVRDVIDIPQGRTFDLVLHAATDTLAVGQVDPLHLFDTVLQGGRNVLDVAVRTGASRVLFTGTGAQYGAIEFGVPIKETFMGGCDSLLASSAYAEAKRAQETLAAIYAERYGLAVVSTRCFAFSGPGISLNEHFAIGNFVRDALWHDELVLKSSGTAVRSYLHGADLAGWLLTLLVRGAAANAYNVGSDKALTIAELAHKVVARIAPSKPVRILGQNHAAQARSFYVPDIQKAKALGLEDWTSLDHSIDSMANWIREAGGQGK